MSTALTVTDATLLAFAEEIGPSGAIAVEGARTRWHRGGPLAQGTRLVRAPDGIVDYQPAEMTVRVRAGTAVVDLHAELATKGQRTALPERGGTVGGALALGEDDLCVLGVGRVRTALLQVRYVSADGRVITGGGGTVKNVSGFDLPRLMVGSLGTLGSIAEATLRTNPIPEVSVWLVADDADPFAARDAVFRSSAVLWDGTTTWIKLEGYAADVDIERRALAATGTFSQTDGPPELPRYRWSLRPSDLRGLRDDSLGRHVASVTGTVFAELPQPRSRPEPALHALMRTVKARFDPEGRCNPGRDPAWHGDG